MEFPQQSNLFEQQKCKKLRAFNGQQPHGRRHRGCGCRCGGEQKIREPQTFRKIRTFQAHPPTRFVKKRVGGVWLCLIFLCDWKVVNSCHSPLDLCALRARVETASSSGLLKKQDIQIGCPDLLWSGLRGSNSLPPPWQGGALPDELSPRNKMYFNREAMLCQEFFLKLQSRLRLSAGCTIPDRWFASA